VTTSPYCGARARLWLTLEVRRRCSADPDDDYLIALAHDQSAIVVSGDRHLLDLADRAPILSPADLLAAAPA
jgi:predicted nucleic acid-binding protein